MPDTHDLETRVQLLERTLAKLLGTDDFEAFLTETGTEQPRPKPATPPQPPQASQAPAHEDLTTVTNASSPRRKAATVRRLLPWPRGRVRHRMAQRREEGLVTSIVRSLQPRQSKPEATHSTGSRAASPPRQ